MDEAAPTSPELLYEIAGPVCTLTLNRPTRRNALTASLVDDLVSALRTADSDPEVRVVVLTGAGGVFCSGADLSQLLAGGAATQSGSWGGGFVELNRAFTEIGKPVIAKVRRYALAGGLGLMCACQFAIAEESAFFATPEIERGIFPMMIMANIFRTVPRRKGLELVLLAKRITAPQAEAMGLINQSVPVERLDEAVDELARKLARKPPQAMRLGLQAFYAQSDLAFADGLTYLEGMLGQCMVSDDAREGLAAFLEKRDPSWRA